MSRGDSAAAGKTVNPGSKSEGSGFIAAAIISAFTAYGLDTRDIRQAAEAGIIASLVEDENYPAEEMLRQVVGWIMAHGDGEG
jgi:hypothetical protein